MPYDAPRSTVGKGMSDCPDLVAVNPRPSFKDKQPVTQIISLLLTDVSLKNMEVKLSLSVSVTLITLHKLKLNEAISLSDNHEENKQV